MKKLFAVFALLVFAGAVIAATTTTTTTTSDSKLESYVNSKLSPITDKEKELNAKREAAEANRAANKAAVESKLSETKKAIQTETNSWKSLKSN